jgi:ABC-2 type transport system permease protein
MRQAWDWQGRSFPPAICRAPGFIVDAVRSMAFFVNFQHITDGVLELPSVVFFVSLIVFCLWLNVRIIEVKKAA